MVQRKGKTRKGKIQKIQLFFFSLKTFKLFAFKKSFFSHFFFVSSDNPTAVRAGGGKAATVGGEGGSGGEGSPRGSRYCIIAVLLVSFCRKTPRN